ncbi:MAG: hypothetical protein IIC76_00615 [Bacteroidetes bacterium]|nr:hypothetical protein [Bacteroidota bacterium]
MASADLDPRSVREMLVTKAVELSCSSNKRFRAALTRLDEQIERISRLERKESQSGTIAELESEIERLKSELDKMDHKFKIF